MISGGSPLLPCRQEVQPAPNLAWSLSLPTGITSIKINISRISIFGRTPLLASVRATDGDISPLQVWHGGSPVMSFSGIFHSWLNYRSLLMPGVPVISQVSTTLPLWGSGTEVQALRDRLEPHQARRAIPI